MYVRFPLGLTVSTSESYNKCHSIFTLSCLVKTMGTEYFSFVYSAVPLKLPLTMFGIRIRQINFCLLVVIITVATWSMLLCMKILLVTEQ